MISIVVPVYRSAGTLGELHARIEATMARIGREFETIFVEDGSGNDSWDVVRRIAALLDALERVDVVYGAPTAQTHGVLRNVASTVTKLLLQRSMGAETAQRISALRAFRTELREAFADYRSPYVNIDVLLTWATIGASLGFRMLPPEMTFHLVKIP